MHLAGFIIKKFVTMHGYMNVKFVNYSCTTKYSVSDNLDDTRRSKFVPIHTMSAYRRSGGLALLMLN
jgi:hypothetical protein